MRKCVPRGETSPPNGCVPLLTRKLTLWTLTDAEETLYAKASQNS